MEHVDKIEYIGICYECSYKNEVLVPRDYSVKLVPRYCAECGNKVNYSKKPCFLNVVSDPQ